MPLKKGKGKKTVSDNISELMESKPSATRDKAIKTIMKRRGVSYERARQIQAEAIALNTAGVSRHTRRVMEY